MDVIMGKQNEKNKYMIPLIFGTIILLTGAIFAINSNKKLLPAFSLDSTPATIPTLAVNSVGAATPTPTPPPPVPTFAPVTKLKIEDIKVGMGPEVASGSAVTVNYIGRLTNGQVFDSSLEQGRQPLTFQVGTGQVIKGWEEGLVGMRVGGQRRLAIPPDKAYGAQGAGQIIPPNATLIFDIALLDVK